MMRIYQMFGVAFLFVPIQTMCYSGVPLNKNNNVSGMTNLARNIGGSIGISIVTTMLARRSQVHQTEMAKHTSAFDPALHQMIANMTQSFKAAGYDAAKAMQMAQARVYGLMTRQAEMLSYLDVIWVFAIVCALMVPLAFLMKRPKSGGELHMH
jgi:DHA2 family multidrug resistance protein